MITIADEIWKQCLLIATNYATYYIPVMWSDCTHIIILMKPVKLLYYSMSVACEATISRFNPSQSDMYQEYIYSFLPLVLALVINLSP